MLFALGHWSKDSEYHTSVIKPEDTSTCTQWEKIIYQHSHQIKLPLIIRFCPRAPELPDEKFFTGALLPSFLCLLNFVHSRREKSNAVKTDSLQSLLPEMTTQHFKWYLKVILTSTEWNDQNTGPREIVLRSCTIIHSLKLRTWQMP